MKNERKSALLVKDSYQKPSYEEIDIQNIDIITCSPPWEEIDEPVW